MAPSPLENVVSSYRPLASVTPFAGCCPSTGRKVMIAFSTGLSSRSTRPEVGCVGGRVEVGPQPSNTAVQAATRRCSRSMNLDSPKGIAIPGGCCCSFTCKARVISSAAWPYATCPEISHPRFLNPLPPRHHTDFLRSKDGLGQQRWCRHNRSTH